MPPPIVPHPNSWYADPQWFAAVNCTGCQEDSGLCATRIKGVRALITPPWALHIGKNFNSDAARAFCQGLENHKASLVICDFPPEISFDLPKNWHIQRRHTRWLRVTEHGGFPALPKHRRKQLRKASAIGLTISQCNDVERVISLHQLARKRKDVESDEQKLEQLLQLILNSPHQSSFIVQDTNGDDLASAVFLHDSDKTVYAFGGQNRSELSGLATVMLINAGLQAAEAIGHKIFDFGGSLDPGVDRFYAEFGAEKILRIRAVLARSPIKWWLKCSRPDLFRAS